MYINKSKYNYNYLQYLNKYLSSLYNKNIEYNLINLKRFYLHSDILSESMKLKLTINKRRMLKQLNIMKKKIKIKDYKKVLHKKFFGNKLDLKKNLIKSPNFQRKEIVKNLNYKHITGFRLEAKGRLTRRYTASRSVSKIRYKGNLLNIYSSYKGMSTVLLKGNLKSNLQYTKLKSKSRIGSFGIKG
jgi:ribosomal VAR1-like protein